MWATPVSYTESGRFRFGLRFILAHRLPASAQSEDDFAALLVRKTTRFSTCLEMAVEKSRCLCLLKGR